MTLSLIIILLGIYVYMTMHKLEYGVYGIILLLPTYLIRFKIAGIPFTFLEGMIVITFCIWLYQVWHLNKKKLKNLKTYSRFIFSYLTGFYDKKVSKLVSKLEYINPWFTKIRIPILFFLLAGIFSLFVAPNWLSAAGIFKAYIVEPLLFFIVFISVINTSIKLDYALKALGSVSIFIALYGICQYIFGFDLLIESYQGIENSRITSVFEYPNAVGLFLASVIALFTPVIFNESFKAKDRDYKNVFFALLVVVAGIIAIVLAETEAALVAYAAVVALYMAFYNNTTRRLLLVAGVVGMVIAGSYPALTNKIHDKITLQDFSGHIRQHTYTETWEMLQQHAIFGAGLSGYQEAMVQYHQDIIWIGKVLQPVEIFLYPHNIILNFWSELGILGVLTILYILGYIFVQSMKNGRNLYMQMVLLALLIIVIHGLVDVPFFKNDLAVLFWLIIGIYLIHQNLEKKYA